MKSRYYTDPEPRNRIDHILKKASTMMANLGTNTKLDVGSLQEAKRLEKKWLEDVKGLDHETYVQLVPQKGEEK